MDKKLLLILNPCSGKRIGKRYLADVVDLFGRRGFVPTVFVTAGRGHATELAAAHGGAVDLVVCLGGDGTFNEVVSGLLQGGHTTPIGYIPCGSTNDFAASIGLKKSVLKATCDILDGTAQTYDVGLFGERYFTYVASFGAFTRASYATSQSIKNMLGHTAYLLGGIKDMSHIRSKHLRFELEDGEVIEGDYIFGAISNSTSLGGVLKLDSELVDMNDGQFELLLVKRPHTIAEMNDCVQMLTSHKYKPPVITFRSASRVTVISDPAMDWSLDGEHCEGCERLEIRNLHDAIRLVKP